LTITADTNVLVRAVLNDDPRQSALARQILHEAYRIAVPTEVLCELAWVLRQGMGYSRSQLGDAFRMLLDSSNVVTDERAVEAGLSMLAAGGDFADGVIAFQGRRMGGGIFVTFDKRAATILRTQGDAIQLLT